MFKWLKSAKKLFSGIGSERALVRIHDDGFMSDNIAVSIEDIIAEDDSDELGKLHVLSLTEFREALGSTWDTREAKIHLLTEGVLRDRVGKENRWEHKSAEIYIMLFPTLSEMEGSARAYDIAEELGRKIIGERFDGSRRPLVRVAGVDPKEALKEDGTFNLEKLEAAGRAGTSAGDASSTKAPSGNDDETKRAQGPNWQKNQHDHDDANTDWKARQHHSKEHEVDWQKQSHDHKDTDTDWQKNQHGRRTQANLNWTQNTQSEKKQKHEPNWVSIDKGETVQPPANAPENVEKPKYSVGFSPCWEKESQSLRLYRSLLVYKGPNAQVLEGSKAYGGHKSETQRLKIDLWLLQQTAKALFGFNNRDIITPVFIPVHSSTVRGDHLTTYLKTLATFNASLRERFFIVEILDDGTWSEDSLSQSVAALKEQSVQIALTPYAKTDFNIPLCNGLDWLGLDFLALDKETGISPDRLDGLIAEAKKLNLKTYAFGLIRRAQVADMIELGMDVIGGSALVRTTDKLRPPFALPVERLH